MPVSPRSFRTEGKEFVSCLYGPMQTATQKKRGTFSKKAPRHKQFDLSVAIVVVVSFFVPAFVLAVVFVPAAVVTIVVMVPVVVVLDAPVRTFPVATVVVAPFIVWNDPDRANIRRTRPVSSGRVIMTLRWIPVAVDPHVRVTFRIGAWRAHGDHSRRGRCADLDSDGDLAERCGRAAKECASEHEHSNPHFVVEFHVHASLRVPEAPRG